MELSVGEAWLGERRIFTGFIRDLTERQQTLLRLQDLQSELAHVGRVSEMGTLASSLAHELNQPLTAVASYCESARDLLDSDPDAETLAMVREALDEAAQQAVRAGQIVRRLRDFMSNGEMERRVESLQRLINEANALALVGSREHGIDVQLSLDPRADQVLVDRIQIQQVLVNLIRNAIDAMMETRAALPDIQHRPRARRPGPGHDRGYRVRGSAMRSRRNSSSRSSRRSRTAWASACRSAARSSRRMAGASGSKPGSNGGTAFHFTLPSGDAKQ